MSIMLIVWRKASESSNRATTTPRAAQETGLRPGTGWKVTKSGRARAWAHAASSARPSMTISAWSTRGRSRAGGTAGG